MPIVNASPTRYANIQNNIYIAFIDKCGQKCVVCPLPMKRYKDVSRIYIKRDGSLTFKEFLNKGHWFGTYRANPGTSFTFGQIMNDGTLLELFTTADFETVLSLIDQYSI